MFLLKDKEFAMQAMLRDELRLVREENFQLVQHVEGRESRAVGVVESLGGTDSQVEVVVTLGAQLVRHSIVQ